MQENIEKGYNYLLARPYSGMYDQLRYSHYYIDKDKRIWLVYKYYDNAYREWDEVEVRQDVLED